MIDILYITAHDLQRGGVEKCIESWVSHYPTPEELRITWYCPGEILNASYALELQQIGVSLVMGNIPGSKKYKNRKYSSDISALLQSKKYDLVHVNTGSPLPSYYALRIAKKMNVPVRIAHAHSYVKTNRLILKLYFLLLRILNRCYSTYRLACSEIAGHFLFGNSFHVLKNAIDVGSFGFSVEQRQRIRRQLNIDNQNVIGYIGTFTTPKNPLFALQVFATYCESDPEAVMLMLGQGPLEEAVKKKIIEYGEIGRAHV